MRKTGCTILAGCLLVSLLLWKVLPHTNAEGSNLSEQQLHDDTIKNMFQVPGEGRRQQIRTETFGMIGFEFVGSAAVYDKEALPAPYNIRTYTPDGHLSSVRVVVDDEENATTTHKFVSFWSHATNFRTVGDKPLSFEDGAQTVQIPGFDYTSEDWCSGGLWLMAVLDLGLNNTAWVGIWHAEDTYAPLDNPSKIAWKSIGVSQSTDQGRTWSKPRRILTAHQTKPQESPEWGGVGDCHAVYDERNARIVIFFQEKNDWNAALTVAMTTDLTGLQGWKKFNGTAFANDGDGGEVFHLENLKQKPGSNPSVHWNEYLNKWIMVWHAWAGDIYLSSSDNLVHWGEPQLLVSEEEDSKVWYPTLMDHIYGDSRGGQEMLLYYAKMSPFPRDMMVHRIIFSAGDPSSPTLAPASDWPTPSVPTTSPPDSSDLIARLRKVIENLLQWLADVLQLD